MSVLLQRRRRHFGALAITASLLMTFGCGTAGGTDLGDSGGAAPAVAVGGEGAAAVEDPPAGKVTVAGDSISLGIGMALREVLEDRDLKVIGETGTGLARPDSFDWPARLEELAADFPPDVLVLSLGSNDAQDLHDEDGDTVAELADQPEWDAEYSTRLALAFDAFAGTGTTVLWLGHVRTEDDDVGLRNRHIHQLAEQLASSRSWVVVGDLAEILGSGEKVASYCLSQDGLHLRDSCLERVAQWIRVNEPVA